MSTCWWKPPNPVWAITPSFWLSMYSFTEELFQDFCKVHKLKKLFMSCALPEEREMLRRAHTHTHFFLTRERLHNKSLNTCITTWFVGLPLLHCPAEHAAHYVHIETIRFYGCGSVWRTFEAITAMLQVYICMNESASPSIINMRIEESVHCVESVCKHAKHWTHCTLQNGGTLHPKIWWCMTWRIFFFVCLFRCDSVPRVVVCVSRAQSTCHALPSFLLVPPEVRRTTTYSVNTSLAALLAAPDINLSDQVPKAKIKSSCRNGGFIRKVYAIHHTVHKAFMSQKMA